MNPDVDTSFLPDREREEEERKLRYVTQSATCNFRALSSLGRESQRKWLAVRFPKGLTVIAKYI